MRIERGLTRTNQSEVRSAVRAVLLENELRVRLQFVLTHAGPAVAHRLHDSQPRDSRGFPKNGDLSRTLRAAHRVEDRIEILNLEARRGRLQLLDERFLA